MTLDGVRDKLGYQPFLLGVVALTASAVLSGVSAVTAPAIAAAEAEDLRRSLSEVLPEGMADNDFLNDTMELARDGTPVTLYRARKDGSVSAAMFKVTGKGYAGPIDLLMAVDMEGRTLGVRVLKHSETPGLGDKIEINKDDWVLDFNGRSLNNPEVDRWAVKKDNGDFDQFAGATITPRAVVGAVRGGLEFFAANRERIAGDHVARGES